MPRGTGVHRSWEDFPGQSALSHQLMEVGGRWPHTPVECQGY